MNSDQHVKEAQLRAISIYEKRPEHAKIVHRGHADIHEALTCVYEQDGHSITIDMAETIGGHSQGPPPGYFGRAAICGCLAIGIKMRAVREDICIESLHIEIAQDWDNRGVLGIEGASPVPLDTRISIEVTSAGSRSRVEELVAEAVAQDPWFLCFRDAQVISAAIKFVDSAS